MASRTDACTVELGTQGVTVNCICPGAIHTGLTTAIPDKAKETFARRRVPLKRYGNQPLEAQQFLDLFPAPLLECRDTLAL